MSHCNTRYRSEEISPKMMMMVSCRQRHCFLLLQIFPKTIAEVGLLRVGLQVYKLINIYFSRIVSQKTFFKRFKSLQFFQGQGERESRKVFFRASSACFFSYCLYVKTNSCQLNEDGKSNFLRFMPQDISKHTKYVLS